MPTATERLSKAFARLNAHNQKIMPSYAKYAERYDGNAERMWTETNEAVLMAQFIVILHMHRIGSPIVGAISALAFSCIASEGEEDEDIESRRLILETIQEMNRVQASAFKHDQFDVAVREMFEGMGKMIVCFPSSFVAEKLREALPWSRLVSLTESLQ